MTMITSREYIPRTIIPMTAAGGFDVNTKTFTPFAGEPEPHQVMDALAAAIEAGAIDGDRWVVTVFKDLATYEFFLERFRDEYSNAFRVHDRYWHAFAAILDTWDEEGLITADEIADAIEEQLEADGQLKLFKQEKAKAK